MSLPCPPMRVTDEPPWMTSSGHPRRPDVGRVEQLRRLDDRRDRPTPVPQRNTRDSSARRPATDAVRPAAAKRGSRLLAARARVLLRHGRAQSAFSCTMHPSPAARHRRDLRARRRARPCMQLERTRRRGRQPVPRGRDLVRGGGRSPRAMLSRLRRPSGRVQVLLLVQLVQRGVRLGGDATNRSRVHEGREPMHPRHGLRRARGRGRVHARSGERRGAIESNVDPDVDLLQLE